MRHGIRLATALWIAIQGGVSPPLAAVQHWTQDSLPMREEGVDYRVTFDVTSGQLDLYANGEDCGNPNHRTVDGGRYFEHFHISYSLPKTGVDAMGEERTVTAANTTAYWDSYYSDGYARIGPENVTYNCWGYSLGYDVWIQDPSYIYEDDYEETSEYRQGNMETTGGHIISITAVNADETGITQTREKNQNSPIYEKDYDPARTVQSGYVMRARR